MNITTNEPIQHNNNNNKKKADVNKHDAVRLQTFRFNFANSVMEDLTVFSKVHQHDSRIDFKDAWKVWLDQNKVLVENETTRLAEAGFSGNVVDKMFKSVRYYFRKKSMNPSTQPSRKPYEGIHTPILLTMDEQIHTQIDNHILDGNIEGDRISSISPAEAFILFCDDYQRNIVDAMRADLQIVNGSTVSRDTVSTYTNRLRKTYKNRFYNIRVTRMNAATTITIVQ